MNLLEIRKKFRELSGRYDLVNDDFSDNGADFFINEASRWLDKTTETSKSSASYMTIVEPSTWYINFPLCRAVKEVWFSTSVGRWQLTKKRYQDLLAGYFSAHPSVWQTGSPLHYAPFLSRQIPEDLTPAQIAEFAAFTGVIESDGHDFNIILLSVPIEEQAMVEIYGLFYSMALEEDESTNYWSTVHPLLLIQVAIRQTHLISGNKPMLDIVDRGLDGDLQRLDRDIVEQIISEIDQMDG